VPKNILWKKLPPKKSNDIKPFTFEVPKNALHRSQCCVFVFSWLNYTR
jgi:hypothetical protein